MDHNQGKNLYRRGGKSKFKIIPVTMDEGVRNFSASPELGCERENSTMPGDAK